MEIEDIKKINLNEGDVLIIRLPPSEGKFHKHYANVFKSIFPAHNIIVTRSDVEIDIVSESKTHFSEDLFEI